jgi:hypothetical protein
MEYYSKLQQIIMQLEPLQLMLLLQEQLLLL